MTNLEALQIDLKNFKILTERVTPLFSTAADVNRLELQDPYLSWAALAHFQTIRPSKSDAEHLYLSVFVELGTPGSLPRSSTKLGFVRPRAEVEGLKFASALLRVKKDGSTVISNALASVGRAILTAPNAALSDVGKTTPAGTGGLPSGGVLFRFLLTPAPKKIARLPARVDSQLDASYDKVGRNKPASRVLIGIADDGFGLANFRLHPAGRSGLRAFWHQGLPDESDSNRDGMGVQVPQPRTPWRKYWRRGPRHVGTDAVENGPASGLGFTYGFELDAEELARSLKGSSAGAAEIRALQEANYLFPLPRWTHGSAMAHVILQQDRQHRLRTDASGAWRMAAPRHERSRHPHVLVQLPQSTVLDTSGVSLAAYAYDAILYIMDNAEPGENVVVNLSYGTYGGPHDGSSLFERAIVDLLERYGGIDSRTNQPRDPLGRTLHVVVPAGNSHVERAHFGAMLSQDRPSASMLWHVPPDSESSSFLEIWMPAGSEVKVVVKPPSGMGAAEVVRGNQFAWVSEGTVHGAVIYPRDAPNALTRDMALVAVAPTRQVTPAAASDVLPPPKLRGPHGVWQIDLAFTGAGAGSVRVDAWVQRDDSAPGRLPPRGRPSKRQSRFLDLPTDGLSGVFPECTLNGIATASHQRLYVVGAMLGSDGTISPYSSAGPTAHPSGRRIDGPDAVAVADASPNLSGVLTGGLLSSARVRVNGTSAAAAQVSRALAEHLFRGGNAASFIWSPPALPSREATVAAGAPTPALAIYRGETARMPLDLEED